MISRRDFLKLGGAALMATAFSRIQISDAAHAAPVIYNGSRKVRKIAMTYDDCWHPEILDQLINMLQPYPDFHFTFFAIGDAIDIDEALMPGIWKKLYQNGHEIGYHTYHHVDPQIIKTKDLIADFDHWQSTLTKALGEKAEVRFARPPYDDLSTSFLELCKTRGLVATMFSTTFEALSVPDSLVLAGRAQNGDIVQMHTYQDPPHNRFDVDITASVVPYLAEQGFQLATLSQLYDDLLKEQNNSGNCDNGSASSMTRVCLE